MGSDSDLELYLDQVGNYVYYFFRSVDFYHGILQYYYCFKYVDFYHGIFYI